MSNLMRFSKVTIMSSLRICGKVTYSVSPEEILGRSASVAKSDTTAYARRYRLTR